MSDAPLTAEELTKLLAGINAGDSGGLEHPAVTQDEINRLLTFINAGYRTISKHTEPLTQDEVNWLLAAIEGDTT